MTRRRIGLPELEDIAIGAAVLGTGGGGDPYVGRLWAQQRIQACGPVDLIDAGDLADDALVIAAAMMGAPSVIVEKIPSGEELAVAFRAVEAACGAEAEAVMCQCLSGNLDVRRPADYAVANAIGAAISEVSGGVDRIVALHAGGTEAVREDVRREAVAQAVAAGADPGAVRIVLWEEIPVAYLPGNAMRLRAKAAGPLADGR